MSWRGGCGTKRRICAKPTRSSGPPSAWERSGRHDDWLLDGARLAGAETLSARPGFGARLNPAGEFLLASRRRVNEKLENEKSAAEAHARSLRRRSQVLAALLAVIVMVAAVAVSVSQQRAEERPKKPSGRSPPNSSWSHGRCSAVPGWAAIGARSSRCWPPRRWRLDRIRMSLLNTLIDTRRLVRVITVPSNVANVDVSPDGRQIVSSGDDGLIRRWDLESGEPVGDPLVGHTGKGRAQLHQGRALDRLERRGQDRTHLGREDRCAVHVLTGPRRPRHERRFSPDGTCSPLGTVTALSSCGTWQPVSRWASRSAADDGWVSAVAFSPDGTRLVTGGTDGAMRVWNVSTHQPADPPLPSHRGSVVDVEFSPDGRRIASMSYLVGH